MRERDRSQGDLVRDLAEMRHRLAASERLVGEYRREHAWLREREELYRQLVENSQGLICKHDLAGNLLYVSPTSALELGYPPEAWVNRNLREFLAPSVQPFFDAYLERIREKEADHGLLRLLSRDGQERLWAYRNVLHRTLDGRPYVIGHAVDITDRVRVETLLRESEERHRAVIEALEEGVVFDSVDGSIKGWNASAERILGPSVDRLLPHAGAAGSDAIQEDGSPFPADAHPGVVTLRTGQPWSNVSMGVRGADGGVVWISVSSRALARPDEEAPYGVVLSFVDLTERRRMERDRDNAVQDALARMKVLSGILSICASCKKIRDRTGRWWPLEVYIRDHSQAEFSHGLCPECVGQARERLRDETRPDR